MSSADELPQTVMDRAAAIARGPHACPHCECPTWTEPPVPWIGLRNYVARCDWCERPIMVRIDRGRIVRRGSASARIGRTLVHDPVAELLDVRGARAFWKRVLVALAAPLLVGAIMLALGGSPTLVIALTFAAVLPSALWAPSFVAIAWSALVSRVRSLVPHQAEVVEVVAGRWDQWLREGKEREVDRRERPDSLLRELGRVLDERELRRVRRMTQGGEMTEQQLDELLLYRRSFQHEPVRMAG